MTKRTISLKIIEMMLTVGGLAGALFGIMFQNTEYQIQYAFIYGMFLLSTFTLFIGLLTNYKITTQVNNYVVMFLASVSCVSFLAIFSTTFINDYISTIRTQSITGNVLAWTYALLAIFLFLAMFILICSGFSRKKKLDII